MGYKLSISERGNYILVLVTEAMTRELGRRCGKDATSLGKKHNLRKYLFDLRQAPNVETVFSNYQFAYDDMDDFGFDRRARSAILTAPADTSHNFIVTAFRNAGYNVRLFTDEGAAISWLEESDSRSQALSI